MTKSWKAIARKQLWHSSERETLADACAEIVKSLSMSDPIMCTYSGDTFLEREWGGRDRFASYVIRWLCFKCLYGKIARSVFINSKHIFLIMLRHRATSLYGGMMKKDAFPYLTACVGMFKCKQHNTEQGITSA